MGTDMLTSKVEKKLVDQVLPVSDPMPIEILITEKNFPMEVGYDTQLLYKRSGNTVRGYDGKDF